MSKPLKQLSENLHLKRVLTPKICDQEVLTHPLAYCTWIGGFFLDLQAYFKGLETHFKA